MLVSTTSSKLGIHTTPLLIVHLNVTLLPTVRPVTPLTFDPGVVITVPFGAPTIVHNPELTVGTLPASVNIPLLQFAWSGPAFDTVGVAKFVNTISSKVDTQLPLLTVHLTVALNPDPTPVTVVVVLNVLVIVAKPACKVHSPVPTAGNTAAIVNVLVLH